MKHKQRLRQSIAMWMMASWLMIPLPLQAAGNPVPDNMTLPTGGNFVSGSGTILSDRLSDRLSDSQKNGVMDVKQNESHAVIKWQDFSIGANAQVNFSKNGGGSFNTLNYVTGSNMSQLYGKMNANGGNIYLINPNGVQIGNSAEINVGSLYVSNKQFTDEALEKWRQGTINDQQLGTMGKVTNAELMSLGYIDAAKNITFDGQRIVIDMDRLNQKTNGDYTLTVRRAKDDDFNLVLGTDKDSLGTVTINGESQKADTYKYTWIHQADDLKKVKMYGQYALRDSIDLTGDRFSSIGTEDAPFTGKLDGLGNNIFGLTGTNGLFAETDGASICHLNLIAGNSGVSIQGNNENEKQGTGALIGHAKNTHVEDVINTLDVTGSQNIGGLVGLAENSHFYNVVNTGHVSGYQAVGGLIGKMEGGTLGNGENTIDAEHVSHNVGKVEGINDNTGYSHHIGGLVGYASKATIGNQDGSTISNLMHIVGGYDVGGIVGRAQDTKLYNLSNEGDILATGYKLGDYIFHTDYTINDYSIDGAAKVSVRIANAGGIVGSISVSNPDGETADIHHASRIEGVRNSGDVKTETEHYKGTGVDAPYYRYIAGNVGGIVGRARNTEIDTATNTGNHVYGAHNVGGIVGFFGRDDDDANAITKQSYYRIRNAINEGGDVMGTGAVTKNGDFSTEITRSDYKPANDEKYITGNIGGIAGMVSGVHTLVANSGNRGSVHTYIRGLVDDSYRSLDSNSAMQSAIPPEIAKAANIGGIVGKIDRGQLATTGTKTLNDKLQEIKNNPYTAGIASCYNIGTVAGYANIGGILGFSYNSSIASSYNLGNVYTTRQGNAGTTPVNIGGILGDSTEHSTARTILYDVFNTGKIGTEDFTYYGRHVGGIVGRLSGIVEKAYNTGAIYNGSTVVGGIAGWWYSGYMKNVFNTGNITVLNKNTNKDSDTSKVGGIVGGVDVAGGNDASGVMEDMSISFAYNLGTLRSFMDKDNMAKGSNGKYVHANSVGGIAGGVYAYKNGEEEVPAEQKFSLSNVYTTGNLAAFIWDVDKQAYVIDKSDNTLHQWAIIGSWGQYSRYNKKENVYAIKTNSTNDGFGTLSEADNDVRYIEFKNRLKAQAYQTKSTSTQNKITGDGFTFYKTLNDIKKYPDSWRIDENSGLPILNAFYTDTDKFQIGNKTLTELGNDTTSGIQITHGTAYNPYLTIIQADKQQWGNTSLTVDAQNTLQLRDSLAVYGTGLTIHNFAMDCSDDTENHLNVYGGLLYSDGALVLHAKNENGITIGKASQIYGSSVAMDFNDQSLLKIFGEVTATGIDERDSQNGNITINAGSLESYWKLNTAKKDQSTTITGGNKLDKDAAQAESEANNPEKTMPSIGTYYSYMTGEAKKDGDLTIHTTGSTYLLYGNMKQGQTTVYGDMAITSDTGDIFVDTDLYVGGKISLTGDHKLILDVTHVGARNNAEVDHAYGTAKTVQNFFETHHEEEKEISFIKNDGTINSQGKIALDMWYNADETDDSKGNFNFEKFDKTDSTLQEAVGSYKDSLYYWVKNEYQLKGIQEAAKSNENILGYNFALYNNIEASSLKDKDTYKAIGSGEKGFSGTFDGMDNRIIGLQATDGVFGTLLDNACVSNLKIYASKFTGDTVGALASKAQGSKMFNITGLGNTIIGSEKAGGLVGELGLTASLDTISDQSTVIARVDNTSNEEKSIFAGGLVGENAGGFINNGSTNSAVTIDEITGEYAGNKQLYLGGIAGSNNPEKYEFDFGDGDVFRFYLGGEIENTSVHGITGRKSQAKATVGGIVGINNGYIKTGYNESVIYGNAGVGGIAGKNTYHIENVTNALAIDGRNEGGTGSNVGGIVGIQADNTDDADRQAYIESGRNTAQIQGDANVGGIVGYNSQNSQLHNLENGFMAAIIGKNNVGGLTGINEGIISADGMELINAGTISGNQYVGGITGINRGTIQGISTNITLKETGENAQFFGGVAGWNDTNGIIENAKNKSTILAENAAYVGGIVGKNSGIIRGMENTSSGVVIGKSHVGGIIGYNEASIKATPQQETETITIEEKHPLFEMDSNGLYKLDENGSPIPVYEKDAQGHIIKDEKGNPIPKVEIEKKTITKFKYEKDDAGNDLLDKPVYQYVNTSVVNEGTVIATKGGAGGIIGTNTANLTQVTMLNKGRVHGGNDASSNDGTGGLIGTNTGNILYSSLINDIHGTVTGRFNVGGLVGINSGTIEGGRRHDTAHDLSVDGSTASDQGYYINTIYNNGTIRTGSFDPTKYLNPENAFTASEGTNIGGLIGDNRGKLSAAYNTGVIKASGSTNVGGIVGSNSGTVDQVFTNVMTQDGQNQTITGRTSVGGIVGSNTGAVSNAYTASGTSITGNTWGWIAGTNTGTISNVYGDADNAPLVGTGTGTVEHGYGLSEKKSDYQGFDFDTTWKIYEDHTNPLLKVFLTKAAVPNDVMNYLTYTGQDQRMTMEDLLSKMTNRKDTDFGDYRRSHTLLQYIDEIKNAGTYTNWLWSAQIGKNDTGDFNPNNLGYDFDVKDITVAKKALTIQLGNVSRIYGNSNLHNSEYTFTVDGWVNGEDFSKYLSISKISDGALTGSDSGRVTNDVGTYGWNGTIQGMDTLTNYTLNPITDGQSEVTKAKLSVSLKNISRVYGNLDNKDYRNEYTLNDGTYLVNGDSGLIVSASKDGAIKDGTVTNVQKTQDAGTTYSWEGTLSGVDKLFQNYDVTFNNSAKSKVTKAKLTVGLNDVQRTYGNSSLQDGYTYGASTVSGNVNGDTYDVGDIRVIKTADGALTGNSTGRVTDDVGSYTWTGKASSDRASLTKNYDLEVGTGLSKVTKAKLTVGLNDVQRTYGNSHLQDGYTYGASTVSGNVNGDTYGVGDIRVTKTADGALTGSSTGRVTNDAGSYTWTGEASSDITSLTKNYDLEVGTGLSKVTKAKLHVRTDDQTITVGQTPHYTGQLAGLTNGDSESVLGYLQYGSIDPTYEQRAGTYTDAIQTVQDGHYGMLPMSYQKNYDFTYQWGTLFVQDKTPDTLESFDNVFYDTPWDRRHHFRERRAELYFVDGGVNTNL